MLLYITELKHREKILPPSLFMFPFRDNSAGRVEENVAVIQPKYVNASIDLIEGYTCNENRLAICYQCLVGDED